jgi:hypothetical protein
LINKPVLWFRVKSKTNGLHPSSQEITFAKLRTIEDASEELFAATHSNITVGTTK